MWLINGKDMTAYVQVGPSDIATQDETLDTGLLVVSPLSDEDPISAGTNVERRIGEETASYKVLSDSVRLVSRAPSAYEHSVQIIQNTRFLSMFVLKGMDFQQPRVGGLQTVKANVPFYWNSTEWSVLGLDEYYHPAVGLYSKLKISKAKVSLKNFSEDIDSHTGDLLEDPIRTISGVAVCSIAGGTWTEMFTCPVHKTGDEYYLTSAQIGFIKQAGTIGLRISFPNISLPLPASLLIANAVMEIQSYYYSLLDVLQGIIDGSHRPSSTGYLETSPCFLPSSGDFFDFLNSAIAPDFQFQQGTALYDALAEVYRSFDAVPTLTEGNVLGVEYTNRRGSELQDGAVSTASSASDDMRVSGLVCAYQNGVATETAVFPCKGLFAKPRTADLGVPSSNKWYFPTPKPINRITHVWVKIGKAEMQSDITTLYFDMNNIAFPIPIDDFVLEKSEWSLLDSDPTHSKRIPTQQNTFWYEKGKKGIYVGNINSNVEGSTYSYYNLFKDSFERFFGGDPSANLISFVRPTMTDDWAGPWDLDLCVEYIPQQDGVMRVEGPSDKPYGSLVVGEALLNQSSGLVDLAKLGSSLFGVACRTGEAKKTKLMKLVSFAGRPLKGQWVKEGNDYWVVENAKTVELKDGVYSYLELTKNFNQISRKITLDREVSFMGIDPDKTLKSEIIYQEYLYFSLRFPAFFGSAIHSGELMMRSVACSAMDTVGQYAYKKPTFASFSGSSGDFGTNTLYMPILCYAGGNAVCFEGGFDGPINAGNGLEAVPDWFTYDLTSFANYYADARGFCDTADIKICADGAVDSFDDFPIIDEPSVSMASFSALRIQKRPNDVFAFNYELIALPYRSLPYPDLMIYPKLLGECYAVTGRKPTSIRLFLLSFGDNPYSNFENAARGTENVVANLTVKETGSGGLTDLYKTYSVFSGGSAVALPANCLGWMIADSEGNPLIASNQTLAAGSAIVFYVFTSHSRL